MKLVVMIPAYNEEQNIEAVIKSVPRKIARIDEVEVLVIDDGSDDRTAMLASKAGADCVISQKMNRGLAFTFKLGLEKSLEMGADIIVNTDADNQYDQAEIPQLIEPVLNHDADIVLGNRQVRTLDHMPFAKKYGNCLGSFVMRRLTGLPVTDTQTGFRAFSREAALRLNILSDYTYTQETIIQAVSKKMAVVEIPCTFRRRDGGSSKLISSVSSYIKRVAVTILRTYTMYRPLKVFLGIGSVLFSGGFILGVRFMYYYLGGHGSGHVQSVILSMILMILGFLMVIFGLLADVIDANRRTTEELLYRIKKRDAIHERLKIFNQTKSIKKSEQFITKRK